MKSFEQFMEGHMHKTCPKGKYYCYTDKKCKKMPSGYHVGRGGYLEKDNDSDSEDSKNGSSNGNDSGSNGTDGTGGNGNGTGGNGGGE